MRPTANRKPGEIHWEVFRRNLDGSEPRYYLSNAAADTLLQALAQVGGSRRRIETEFETWKSDVGLYEFETHTCRGWHYHVTPRLLAGVFLFTPQQDWRKDTTDYQGAGVRAWCMRCCLDRVLGRKTVAMVGRRPAAQPANQTLPSETPRHPVCARRCPSLIRRCNARMFKFNSN